MQFISDPGEIEKKSFEAIGRMVEGTALRGPEKDVVMRVVHATADPDFIESMVFSEGAAGAGIDALKAGCTIITDVNMLRAGISPARPGGDGGAKTLCFISDPDVVAEAANTGTSRAAAAMRKAAALMDGAVVVVGNAPTALYELIRLVDVEGRRPALVVGVPVGFVGAAESKEALTGLKGAPFITNRGRKGGSSVGAAVVNALIKHSL